MKRESEYVCKDNSYNSAICSSDGTVVWVSGNNHIFQVYIYIYLIIIYYYILLNIIIKNFIFKNNYNYISFQ